MNFSTWLKWIAVLSILIAFEPTLAEDLNYDIILEDCESCAFDNVEKCGPCYKLHQDRCSLNMTFMCNENIEAYQSSLVQCSTVNVHCEKAKTSKYRTMDGSCNNLQNPSWGKSNICLRRFLPHHYADGKSCPRKSCIRRRHLPNAREISNYIHEENESFPGLDFHTVMFTIYGQFIAHDLSLNDIQPLENHGEKICCRPKAIINDECIAVDIPKDDPYFIGERKKDCLPLPRTKHCPLCDCGKREALNEVTSYMDLSPVYGNNLNESNSLRSFEGGMLKVQEIPDVGSLPLGTNKIDTCDATKSEYKCFVTGDKRANLHFILATVQIIFHRYHNYLCQRLKRINPCWDDEKLYQESRRISIAQAQLIFYGYYLPKILGQRLVNKFGLGIKGLEHGFNVAPEVDIKHLSEQDVKKAFELGDKPEPELDNKPESHYTTYDPSLDASTTDEFTTCALRYGHTMVRNFYFDIPLFSDPSDLKMPDGKLPGVEPSISPDGKTDFKINEKHMKYLRDNYNKPDEFYQKPYVDRLAQGSGLLVGWKLDTLYGTDIRNYLLAKHDDVEKGGTDLAAISILRGRDHGIPSYTYYLKYFFNYEVKTFCDLKKFIPKDLLKKLRKLYKSVHDIDLFTAGLSENHLKEAIVGPTFASMLINQYRKSKFGDRFHFEHENQAGSFTPEQLAEIRKITLSRMICDTTKISFIQKDMFYIPQPGNPLLPCDVLPVPDLNYWKEKCD